MVKFILIFVILTSCLAAVSRAGHSSSSAVAVAQSQAYSDGSGSSSSASASASASSSSSSNRRCPGPNEVWDPCPDCHPQTCATRNNTYYCPQSPSGTADCRPACRCRKGYFRNSRGICVPACECDDEPPLQCGPNEVEQCVQSCPPETTCRTRGIAYACLYDPTPCKRKCVCAEGYYRNSIGECITGEQCDRCTKENEFWSCNSACDNECINIETQNRTNCPIINIQCNERCYCDDGYARDAYGNCIPVDQCRKPCLNCGPNEVEQCVKPCPPETTCRTRGIMYKCAEDPNPCEWKCVCAEGYYRNAIGECITNAQCDLCTKENEFWSCNSACDNECKNIDTQNRTNCPIYNIKCNERCYCDDGYARDAYGNCIPVDQCKICPENEVYSECPTAICGPLTCAEAGYQSGDNCGNSNPCSVDPGCICKPGYLRNCNGVCIPSNQCPSCGGDVNAIPGCGNHCGKTCADIGQGPIACPQFCYINGCDCRPGYLYDTNTRKCVLERDCSNTPC